MSAQTMIAGAGLVAVVLATGCGSPPQVGAGNYQLVAAVQTAVSARRADWLEDAAKVATERKARGELNDEQFAALDAVIAQARAGNWEAAATDIAQLAKVQRGSAEEAKQHGAGKSKQSKK